jgi:hypothetical protein
MLHALEMANLDAMMYLMIYVSNHLLTHHDSLLVLHRSSLPSSYYFLRFSLYVCLSIRSTSRLYQSQPFI